MKSMPGLSSSNKSIVTDNEVGSTNELNTSSSVATDLSGFY